MKNKIELLSAQQAVCLHSLRIIAEGGEEWKKVPYQLFPKQKAPLRVDCIATSLSESLPNLSLEVWSLGPKKGHALVAHVEGDKIVFLTWNERGVVDYIEPDYNS